MQLPVSRHGSSAPPARASYGISPQNSKVIRKPHPLFSQFKWRGIFRAKARLTTDEVQTLSGPTADSSRLDSTMVVRVTKIQQARCFAAVSRSSHLQRIFQEVKRAVGYGQIVLVDRPH